MTLADKIVVLRDGAIAQVGSPLTLYDDPDNLFVAGFIGSPKMNFFDGVIADRAVRLPAFGDTAVPLAAVAAMPPAGTRVTVGIRPEHFDGTGAGSLPLTIDMIEHLGAETYAYARYGQSDLVTVAARNGRDLKSGDALTARFDPAKALIFDEAGRRIR
jgi:lactose/L-arabinose transport system ATP-binding protein